jgi:RNA polymerase sigma-32 factor
MNNNMPSLFIEPLCSENIDKYISSVNSLPILSIEEEMKLFVDFKENNNLDAAKTITLAHLRVVVSVARKYAGYGLPLVDLIQEGNLGLMKAVKKFNIEKGVRLVTFALYWIKSEIQEFVLKNWKIVKIATTKAQRKLFFNLRSFKGIDNNSFTNNEISGLSDKLNVKKSDVISMEMRLTNNDSSLSSKFDDSDEKQIDISDNTYNPSINVEEEDYDKKLKSELYSILDSKFDDRTKYIINNRYLTEKAMTLSDLSLELGISPERVRQIESKALNSLSTKLKKYKQ